jgi:ABC-type dipeptide/oligopeptide/nickel transport system ATPase subunit
LFADGPAPHLELIDQKEIIDLLVNYVHQRQCVVLPTNHNTDLTEKTADRTFIGSVTAEIEKGFFEVNTN